MTQEKGDEVKASEAKVEEPKVEEVKIPSPQEELDAARQQLSDLQTKLVAAQEEAKAHQKVVSKKDQELQDAKRKADDITELKERLELQEAYLAELAGKGSEGGQELVQKFKTEQQQRKYQTLMNKRNETSAKITELIRDTGLTSESPELETARVYFERADRIGDVSDYERAVRKVEEAVAKIPPKEDKKVEERKEVETEEARVERLANERLKQKMIEKGLLTPEGGEPSAAGGGTFKRSEIAALQKRALSLPPKERKELLNRISTAFSEGKVLDE